MPTLEKERPAVVPDTDRISQRNLFSDINLHGQFLSGLSSKTITFIEVPKSVHAQEISKLLGSLIHPNFKTLKENALIKESTFTDITKEEFEEIRARISKMETGKTPMLRCYERLFHLKICYDLVQTEGFYSFLQYVGSKLEPKQENEAIKSIITSASFLQAKQIAQKAIDSKEEHGKITEIINLSNQNKGKRIVIFVQNRSTLEDIIHKIKEKGIQVSGIILKEDGKLNIDQKKLVSDFNNREFNLLIANSSPETSLAAFDPSTLGMIIFYEPDLKAVKKTEAILNSEKSKSKIVVLVTNDTKEAEYFKLGTFQGIDSEFISRI